MRSRGSSPDRSVQRARLCSRLFAGGLLLASIAIAVTPELRWGGPGYDPSLKPNSSRFWARPRAEEGLIDLWIDTKETWKEVGTARIVSNDGKKSAESSSCSKAMRHVTAPWLCSFASSSLEQLGGMGSLKVFDRAGRLVLEEKISVSALRSLTSGATEKR